MMDRREIFDFTDYRAYLRYFADFSQDGAKRGGELKRIAAAARIFPSYLSQILNGKRDLTLDQAVQVADYCGLKELERKYLLILIQLSRAATTRLRTELSSDMQALKDRHLRLSSRLPDQKSLTLEDAAEFYSSWIYIAIRIYTAIPGFQTIKALAAKFGLPERQVSRVIKFLVKSGLCLEVAPGKFTYGPAHMHLSADHPLVTKHHANWRVHALEKHTLLDQRKELAYTGVFALSQADAEKIRAFLPQWIEQVRAIADPSSSEASYFLNLDWIEI